MYSLTGDDLAGAPLDFLASCPVTGAARGRRFEQWYRRQAGAVAGRDAARRRPCREYEGMPVMAPLVLSASHGASRCRGESPTFSIPHGGDG